MCYSLISAWWLRASLVIALFIGGAWYHHHITSEAYKAGYAERDDIAKRDEAVIQNQVAQKYAKDLASAQAETTRLQLEANAVDAALKKEKDQHAKDLAKHVAAALAGAERLRIATSGTSSEVRDKASPESARTERGTSAKEGTDLLPEAAATILSIAADNAGIVRDYNTLIDKFNSCRATANAD